MEGDVAFDRGADQRSQPAGVDAGPRGGGRGSPPGPGDHPPRPARAWSTQATRPRSRPPSLEMPAQLGARRVAGWGCRRRPGRRRPCPARAPARPDRGAGRRRPPGGGRRERPPAAGASGGRRRWSSSGMLPRAASAAEAMAAHPHGEDQLGGEALQQDLDGVDGGLPAPRLPAEQVHLVAEEDADQEAVRSRPAGRRRPLTDSRWPRLRPLAVAREATRRGAGGSLGRSGGRWLRARAATRASTVAGQGAQRRRRARPGPPGRPAGAPSRHSSRAGSSGTSAITAPPRSPMASAISGSARLRLTT